MMGDGRGSRWVVDRGMERGSPTYVTLLVGSGNWGANLIWTRARLLGASPKVASFYSRSCEVT